MSDDVVEVRGKVEFADVSEQTYKGGARLHGFKINGQKYSNFVKQDQPLQGAKKGDTVAFNAKQNDKGYWNFDPKSFQIIERGSSQQSYPPQQEDNKQSSIVRQSSMGYASHVVAAFAQSGYYQSPDEAVRDMIELADNYIFPYAMNGKEQVNAQNSDASESQQNDNDFDDEDFPF